MSDELLKVNGDASCLQIEDRDSLKLINKGLVVNNNGKNNIVKIGKGAILNNVIINFGSDNNVVEIGANTNVTFTAILKIVPNNKLLIGNKTTIGGCSFICGEGTTIKIGEDCMLAWGLEFRSTDSHAIVDRKSRARLNQGKDITIEDHVWVGAHSTILKGSHIAKDSVVSIRSVISKPFTEEGVVIGGIPGKVIKRDIDWERPLLG